MTDFINLSLIRDALLIHQKPSKQLSYGTAGFRDNINLPLHSTFVRMGVLACLRSSSVGCKPIGLMITASHNPECDNGIKIVDQDGGMMSQTWEPFAEMLANIEPTLEAIGGTIQAIKSVSTLSAGVPIVIVGRDTRPHSQELFDCVRIGVSAAGGLLFDIGHVSTPQVHFVVQHLNASYAPDAVDAAAVKTCFDLYYSKISSGFLRLGSTSAFQPLTPARPSASDCNDLVVDCSFGVGSIPLQRFKDVLGSTGLRDSFTIEARNETGAGRVNEGCGAELVQKSVVHPVNVSKERDTDRLICSYDGDADRIVFHMFSSGAGAGAADKWLLMDGDKIAALAAMMIHSELVEASLDRAYSIGVVQSAYANGASTIFFRERGIPVVMAKTGVKYMHHKAEHFDIGIYFEANGHGTVLFSQRLTAALNAYVQALGVPVDVTATAVDCSNFSRQDLAIFRLHACTLLINQAVGDAISDMLLTLASLQTLRLSAVQWSDLYTDLPSKMIKLPVADKSKIVCNEDETRALEPAGLQLALDAAMATVPLGRCFVRPSGTEDVVRVYAEASTAVGVSTLIDLAVAAIQQYV